MKKVAKKGILEAQGMYLTTEEAAEYLGISVRTLEDRRYKGAEPCFIRLAGDGKVVYKCSELVAWHYRLENTAVRKSEGIIKVRDPQIYYEFILCGENVRNRISNAKEAVNGICEEMIKNSADGFLHVDYRYFGFKATLTAYRSELLSCVSYIFEAE